MKDKDETFNMWIYPTVWPNGAKNDGFYAIVHFGYYNLKDWVKECETYIKTPLNINDRNTAQMSEISKIYKRIFSWKYSIKCFTFN